MYDEEKVRELKSDYSDIREDIEARLKEFEEVWGKGDDRLFRELCFCIFTPQSKARVCWDTVKELNGRDQLLSAEEEEIADEIKKVRFRFNKAGYLVEAREKFAGDECISLKEKIDSFSDQKRAREWIFDNVKGLGLKEASHFLRNIGKGDELAILDRHILKNLDEMGVIESVPKTLTNKRYLEIEEKMKRFSKEIDIPLDHLDLVLWYRETGEIFK
ncbi:MAG: N-glycosylase/DNA lyase [Candidatus Saliniplasma sp.]